MEVRGERNGKDSKRLEHCARADPGEGAEIALQWRLESAAGVREDAVGREVSGPAAYANYSPSLEQMRL